jgi:hypothetical protein
VEVDWTLPAGFSQDAYGVLRTDPSGVTYYWNSGSVSSSAQIAFVPLDSVAGRTDMISVHFLYAGHWSAWAQVNIISQFAPPWGPTMSMVQETLAGEKQPVVAITLANPAGSSGMADTVATDVYRNGIPIVRGLPNNSVFRDIFVGAGRNFYAAQAFSASGGSAWNVEAVTITVFADGTYGVDADDTVSIDNGDGTITLVDNYGSVLIDNGDGSFTFTTS